MFKSSNRNRRHLARRTRLGVELLEPRRVFAAAVEFNEVRLSSFFPEAPNGGDLLVETGVAIPIGDGSPSEGSSASFGDLTGNVPFDEETGIECTNGQVLTCFILEREEPYNFRQVAPTDFAKPLQLIIFGHVTINTHYLFRPDLVGTGRDSSLTVNAGAAIWVNPPNSELDAVSHPHGRLYINDLVSGGMSVRTGPQSNFLFRTTEPGDIFIRDSVESNGADMPRLQAGHGGNIRLAALEGSILSGRDAYVKAHGGSENHWEEEGPAARGGDGGTVVLSAMSFNHAENKYEMNFVDIDVHASGGMGGGGGVMIPCEGASELTCERKLPLQGGGDGGDGGRVLVRGNFGLQRKISTNGGIGGPGTDYGGTYVGPEDFHGMDGGDGGNGGNAGRIEIEGVSALWQIEMNGGVGGYGGWGERGTDKFYWSCTSESGAPIIDRGGKGGNGGDGGNGGNDSGTNSLPGAPGDAGIGGEGGEGCPKGANGTVGGAGNFGNSGEVDAIIESDVLLPEWTILVYSAADNDLEKYGIGMLDLLESLDLGGSRIQIAFQIDRMTDQKFVSTVPWSRERFTDTRRGIVVYDDNIGEISTCLQPVTYPDSELSSGDPMVLKDFITWGMKRAPAKKYILVTHGHGTGTDGLMPDYTNNHDNLTVQEFGNAIRQAVQETGKKLELLVLDNCNMQVIELAAELDGIVKVVVASQEFNRGDYYPAGSAFRWFSEKIGGDSPFPTTLIEYPTRMHAEKWIARLAASPNMQASEIAKEIVQVTLSQSPRNESISALNLEADSGSIMTELMMAIDELSQALISDGSAGLWKNIVEYRLRAREFGYEPLDIDLGEFVRFVQAKMTSGTAIHVAATKILALLPKLVFLNDSLPNTTGFASGLSIHFRKDGYLNWYRDGKFKFLQSTAWEDFLKKYSQQLNQPNPVSPQSEVGNTVADATPLLSLTAGRKDITAFLDELDDVDFYQIVVGDLQSLYVEVHGLETLENEELVFTIVNAQGNSVVDQFVASNGVLQISEYTLPSGVYYLAVTAPSNTTPLDPADGTETGEYSLRVSLVGDGFSGPVLSTAPVLGFGTVPKNWVKGNQLRLWNHGDLPLYITDFVLPLGVPFIAPAPYSPRTATILPHQYVDVPILSLGMLDSPNSRLAIHSNDPKNPIVYVDLTANVVEEEDIAWHNEAVPEDVDGDGSVSPLDVLVIINMLNDVGSVQVSLDLFDKYQNLMLDTDNDDFISPLDVLLVINFLNSASGNGGGGEGPEGESNSNIDAFFEMMPCFDEEWELQNSQRLGNLSRATMPRLRSRGAL